MARVCSVYRRSGSPNVHNYKNAAASAATYGAGDLVKLDSSGLLVIGTTGAAGIFGIALDDSPADVTTDVPVDVITSDGSQFSLKYNGTTAVTCRGENLNVTFTVGGTTSTGHVVDAGSGVDFTCIDLDGDAAVGGRLLCTPVPAALQAQIGL